jgi:hypothetical protein
MDKRCWNKPCLLEYIEILENKIEKFPDFIFAEQQYLAKKR